MTTPINLNKVRKARAAAAAKAAQVQSLLDGAKRER